MCTDKVNIAHTVYLKCCISLMILFIQATDMENLCVYFGLFTLVSKDTQWSTARQEAVQRWGVL